MPDDRARVRGAVSAAVVLAALLLVALPAAAAGGGLVALLVAKLKAVLGALVFALIVGHIGMVVVTARLLGLDGGVLAAVIGAVVGFFLSLVLSVLTALMIGFLPHLAGQLTMFGTGIIGGAAGIKWAFGTDWGHALLTHVLALTTSLLVLLGALVAIF